MTPDETVAPAAPATPRPPNRVTLSWTGERRFECGRPGGPQSVLDGRAVDAQSPTDSVLSALAACSAIDAIEILAKRRTPVESFRCEVEGTRVDTTPRRFRHILLTFHVDGAGIERVHAERALELSITKYCSVRSSLAEDLVIEWTLVLNGQPTGERRPG